MQQQDDIRMLTPLNEEYPEALRLIPDPPSCIYVRGHLPDPNLPCVSIIGARSCSEYGKGTARYFSSVLADAGVQIISGMAKGIDGIAQREALLQGRHTFAILGCGLDIAYPEENRDIFEGICAHGGMISEYPPGCPPLARNFPPRNRIIAALCDILLVIESREHSGTSITVGRAIEQGKDVYAVPGRLSDPLSCGCNRLIADGAGIALSPYTILEDLGIYIVQKKEAPYSENSIKNHPMSGKERRVYSVLDFSPMPLDDIFRAAKIDITEILEILLRLEIRGLIGESGCSNYYRKA